MFDHRHYIPVLNWRMGTYQALLNLDSATKKSMTPLLELPPVDWNFDTNAPDKSIDEKLAKFGRQLKEKWGSRPCFVDADMIEGAAAVDSAGNLVRQRVRMASGKHPLIEAFEQARSQKCQAIPVTALDRDADYQAAVASIVAADGRGFCLRIFPEHFDRPAFTADIATLLSSVGVGVADVDVVIDMAGGPFVPHSSYAMTAENTLKLLPHRAQWRTLSLIGSSFPERLDPAIFRPNKIINREEWLGYKVLARRLSLGSERIPAFGDYTVDAPGLVRLDMRLLDPTAKLKYTIADKWYIAVGHKTKKYGRDQMRQMCKDLKASGNFAGATHCYGCDYIEKCIAGGSTGGSSTWPSVARNHHITWVVNDLANFHASLGKP